MIEVFCAVVAALSMIACAYITTGNKKYQKKAETRAEARAKEGQLMLGMIHAIGKLTVGTALAIKNNHCNGELEEGLQAVSDCESSYAVFIEEIAMAHLRK